NDYLADGTSADDWSTRLKNAAKYQTAPAKGAGGLGKSYELGPNAGCGLAPIARLSANTASIKTTISNMKAVGNTDIAFGLQWGWHVLSPNAPFNDGKPYNSENLSKIIILMTDGNNENTGATNPYDSIYSGIGYIVNNRLGITTGNRTKAMDDR